MDEKVLKRVRALLSKAESTEFEPEAEALRAQAEKLILTYGIEQAMLAATGQIDDKVTTLTIKFDDPFSGRKSYLLHHIARALGCKALSQQAEFGSARVSFSTVVGYASTLEQVELLYTSLLMQSARLLANVRKGASAAQTRSLRSSFLLGFAVRVGERLTKAYKATVDETGDGTGALVLIDRMTAVNAHFASLFPEKPTRVTHRYRETAFNAGMSAADQADLGQSRFGGGRQRSLPRGS